MRPKPRHDAHKIMLVSYHPRATVAETGEEWASIRRYAVRLAQQGHQVSWLSATAPVDAAAGDAILEPEVAGNVPRTCRYVVPCQSYRLGAVQVFCVDHSVWQQRACHTRLFTFLGVLQRALWCDVFHAWGMFPAAYLAVYTARFLGLPVVVSYGAQSLHAGPQQPFEWHWVARHVTRALVSSEAERRRLVATSALEATNVQTIEPPLADAVDTMTALYKTLLLPGRV